MIPLSHGVYVLVGETDINQIVTLRIVAGGVEST